MDAARQWTSAAGSRLEELEDAERPPEEMSLAATMMLTRLNGYLLSQQRYNIAVYQTMADIAGWCSHWLVDASLRGFAGRHGAAAGAATIASKAQRSKVSVPMEAEKHHEKCQTEFEAQAPQERIGDIGIGTSPESSSTGNRVQVSDEYVAFEWELDFIESTATIVHRAPRCELEGFLQGTGALVDVDRADSAEAALMLKKAVLVYEVVFSRAKGKARINLEVPREHPEVKGLLIALRTAQERVGSRAGRCPAPNAGPLEKKAEVH